MQFFYISCLVFFLGCSTTKYVAENSNPENTPGLKLVKNPLEPTQELIFKRMEQQEHKNDVKCWSSVRNIEEMFFDHEISGESLHQKEIMINRFVFQIWLFAQNVHPQKGLLTEKEIDSSFHLISRFRAIKKDSKYQITFINSSDIYQAPLEIKTLDLEDYRRSSSGWRTLLAVANQTSPEILFENMDESAVSRLADLADLYSIVIAKLGNRYAKLYKASRIDNKLLDLIDKRHSASLVNVYGWVEGKDFAERAYAQSLAYSISKIRSLNHVNGKLTDAEIRKNEEKFTQASLSEDGAVYFRKVLQNLAYDLWKAAQVKAPKEAVYVSGSDVFNAIMEVIPYEVDDLANIIFFPNSNSPIKYQEFESDAFRDEATHWHILYDMTKKLVQDGSNDSSRSLKALDIYAAEELSELISNYSVPLLKAAGHRAKSQGRKVVTEKDFIDAHLSLLQTGPNVKRARSAAFTELVAKQPALKTKVLFTNVSTSSGIEALKDPEKIKEERMDAATLMAFDAFRGIATGDIDNDGLTDLFIANEEGSNFVYRNLGALKFENVSSRTKLPSLLASTAGQLIDFNNDGCKDLFVVRAYEPMKLFKGNCDFTFEDVSKQLGLDSLSAAATGAIWFDYDNDSWLDLYVLTTGDFKNGFLPSMGDVETATPKIFFRNLQGKKFKDMTDVLGLGDKRIALAAAATDLFNKGRASIYLANDMQPNSLYVWNGSKYDNKSKSAGVNDFGNGMGVTVADYNKDGLMDMFVTNISIWNPRNRYVRPGQGTLVKSTKELDQFIRSRQTNRLYQNMGDGTFKDKTADLIGPVNMGWGWNGSFLDIDNDSFSDLFVVNGFRPESMLHHDEPKVLLRWSSIENRYVDDSLASQANVKSNSRGSVFADFDNDGDLDIVITGLHSPIVLRNDTDTSSTNWTQIKLTGSKSNKDGYGARVIIKTDSGTQQLEMGNQGGGFISSINDPLHFGLGSYTKKFNVEVRWPSGKISKMENPEPNKVLNIRE